jgi:hypothetical protein
MSVSSAILSTFFVQACQQPARPSRLTPFSRAVLQQRLRELLLIDDLSGRGIDHLCGLGHSLAFRSGHVVPTVFRTVPGPAANASEFTFVVVVFVLRLGCV